MGLFNKNNVNGQPISPRLQLETKYTNSRSNLLLVVLFSAINVFLLVTNSDRYFLFSAFIPYLIADLGMALCGRYPAEYYDGELSEYQFFDDSFFIITVVIAAALIALYLLCWILSKKPRVGWLIFSLVFFSADTVLMLVVTGISSDFIVDVVFHAWVIVSLVSGIMAHYKLKKLPEEPVAEPVGAEEPVAASADIADEE